MIYLMEETKVHTLLDAFGRKHDYLRISITDKCDLRCTYCMPSEKMKFAPSSKLMSADEIFEIAKTFVSLGIKKIRLTGGEPLVRIDATKIIRLLSSLPVELTLTTNATHVDLFMEEFQIAGIKSINVSLDTFQKEKFFEITRRDNFEKVISNIQLLISNDFKVKINVVVMKGVNDDELTDFIDFTRDNPVDVRFIEFMPFHGNGWRRENVFGYKQIVEIISEKYPIEKIEDKKHSTAREYRIEGHAGTFGIISTVTAPFCGDCNRLRLTADGKMKNCLFSKGEIDILSHFRKGEDIYPFIMESVQGKKKELGGQRIFEEHENRSMIAIGG